jgi:two-component system LytT family response regulator
MKKMSVMLIDDEISAINTLQGMLKEYFPQVEVVANAHSVADALLKVQRYRPDVVFLDVEMPPFGSGFDFIEKSRSYDIGIIFVTAYPEYAIKAINEAEPWGYLLKPLNIAELGRAIEKALDKMSNKTAGSSGLPPSLGIIIPDARKGNVAIRVKDIVYCQADGTTTDIYYLKDARLTRITASKTLKDIEEQLPSSLFCRSHHSYLVNFDFVDRYERTGRNGIIHLINERKIPVSVSKMEDFVEQFGAFLHLKSS